MPRVTLAQPATATGRQPTLATIGPELSTPAIEPIESPSSRRPICAVEASTASRMAGVRVTHVASERPNTTKQANSELRQRRSRDRSTAAGEPGGCVRTYTV